MATEEIIDEWMAHGFKCKVTKVTIDSGTQFYQGYVRTPLDSGRSLVNSLVDVHGALSIGIDEEGWLGFDTSHTGDVNLDEEGNVINDPLKERKEWTPSDVRVETEDLAYQIKDVVAFAESVS